MEIQAADGVTCSRLPPARYSKLDRPNIGTALNVQILQVTDNLTKTEMR